MSDETPLGPEPLEPVEPPERALPRRSRHARPARPASRRKGLPTSAVSARRRLVAAFVVLAVIVGALAFGVWSTFYRVTADVPAGRTVSVVIPQGSSAARVADIVAEAGVVANPMMFRVRASLLDAGGDIKAGTYALKTGSEYDDVIRMLAKGPVIELLTVTIPEGWGIAATAARMSEKLGVSEKDFVRLATKGAKKFDFAFLQDNPTDSLEGYLFPKTYDFKRSVTATEVIRVMLTQYGKETASLDYAFSKSKKLTPHDVLTIASIIEREAQLSKDRPKVASVIYNRLAIGMRLQLDSTVQYALNGKVKLNLEDLKTDDPYNTYVYAGVPPGPICNPGISAIKAAAHPANTKYMYYILTHKDGSQSFATNYADFLVLKAQFKKGLK